MEITEGERRMLSRLLSHAELTVKLGILTKLESHPSTIIEISEFYDLVKKLTRELKLHPFDKGQDLENIVL